MDRRVALVTGAGQGIGNEVARELGAVGMHVVLADRNEATLARAVAELESGGAKVSAVRLDVTSVEHVEYAYRHVHRDLGRLDVLVNVAGINADHGTVSDLSLEVARLTFEVNTLGALRLIQRFGPWMRECGYGRIVNFASETASLERMVQSNWPGYRLSKVALVALTRMYAAEFAGTNVLVNALCPGWTRTEMGIADGGEPPRTVAQAADTAVWLATLPDGGPSGGFFRDRAPLPW